MFQIIETLQPIQVTGDKYIFGVLFFAKERHVESKQASLKYYDAESGDQIAIFNYGMDLVYRKALSVCDEKNLLLMNF